MENARRVTLGVRYDPNPFTQQVLSGGNESSAENSTEYPVLKAGTAVTLGSAPIFVSASARQKAGKKSGVFYLYDGLPIRGRYRITNLLSRCGKKPTGTYVTGWVNGEDCGVTAAETPADHSAKTAGEKQSPAAVDISPYIADMTYTDTSDGESDSVDITLDARDERWRGEWFPRKGSAVYPTAKGTDWEKSGDEKQMNCGVFLLDDISYTDSPDTLSLSAVSKPSDTEFSDTKREAIWKNTSVKRIGQVIAARYGLGLEFDGEDQNISSDEQKESDSGYYDSLCRKYGLSVKLYARKIWVYDREKYKEKPAAATLSKSDMVPGSIKWNTTLTGTYTGGDFRYEDSDTGKVIACSVGVEGKKKTLSQKADSVSDALRQLCGELNRDNHSAVTLRCSVMGNFAVSAGCCVNISGLGGGSATSGGMDGKYFVDRATHRFNASGFVTELELSLVQAGFKPETVGVAGNSAGKSSTASASATTYTAGAAVKIENAPLYVSSKAEVCLGYRSGVYYLYDGKAENGRFRLCNLASQCGKTPVTRNSIGCVPKSYCKILVADKKQTLNEKKQMDALK